MGAEGGPCHIQLTCDKLGCGRKMCGNHRSLILKKIARSTRQDDTRGEVYICVKCELEVIPKVKRHKYVLCGILCCFFIFALVLIIVGVSHLAND